MPETEEEISRRPDVREELDRTAPRKQSKSESSDKFWFVIYLVVLLGCAFLYYLVDSKFLPLPKLRLDLAHRILRGAAIIAFLLGISSAVSIYAISRVSDPATRFTLKRIKRLLVFLLAILVAVSVLFVNWYTALISVGVISVIAGLAIQTPLTSFIGWIYLLVRQPYRVGDRIKISDATGDVIDVGYLDTTLWEFGGDYISGDHPSGRIIRFPNSKVLDSIIYNYSWPLFPYIWNEIKVQVAYNSDLEFISETMRRVTEEDLGEAMIERVQTFRKLLARTPVDQLEVHERPRVIFRVSENTWLEAIVRYVIPPRESGATKSRLIKKILVALNTDPSRVCFPAGAKR